MHRTRTLRRSLPERELILCSRPGCCKGGFTRVRSSINMPRSLAENRGTVDVPSDLQDREWMEQALGEARRAEALGEVPIGAVVVCDGKAVGRGHNRRETDGDPLGHAEILAIREAAKQVGGWRLTGCTLYVTLEPCSMCAGALVASRVERLVFGALDPKA